MLHACGGRGYMRDLELERLVRDSKAGWIMAPSNEVTTQIVGKWALLGAAGRRLVEPAASTSPC